MTTTCQNCGTTVSDHFARVAGDNDNQVHACLACEVNTGAVGGEAAGLNRRERGAYQHGGARL